MDIAPMTKRDKILLYAVLMLAFIVLYVRFLLIPGIGSLQQARADLTEAQDAQITMQETILQQGRLHRKFTLHRRTPGSVSPTSF